MRLSTFGLDGTGGDVLCRLTGNIIDGEVTKICGT